MSVGVKCINISCSSFSGTALIIIAIFSSVNMEVSILRKASLKVKELIFNLEITSSTFFCLSACSYETFYLTYYFWGAIALPAAF